MNRVAEEINAAEIAAGMDSLCLDNANHLEREKGFDADIHVIHTHLPDEIDKRAAKTIWVAHGTPEVMFTESVLEGNRGHGSPDAWMAAVSLLSTCDAAVTFWPRHQAIWQSLMPKSRVIDCLPMGIDLARWKPMLSKGKFDGTPSILTAENCHTIKWPLDLIIAMGWVLQEIRAARFHVLYLPMDQSKWFYSLATQNGAAYRSHISSVSYAQADLCNAFCSVDYYAGLVRYGDHNRTCMEAKASGCNVISYRGNEYADYWVDEGDQRTIAGQLKLILSGQIEPRPDITPVPDITETALAMAKIYGRIL